MPKKKRAKILAAEHKAAGLKFCPRCEKYVRQLTPSGLCRACEALKAKSTTK